MIGIVIPAHDEAQVIEACIKAALVAAGHPALGGESVEVMVVLDACRDETPAIVARLAVEVAEVDARNVGMARAEGAQRLLARGARWLAFTDADTQVSPDWLVQQLRQRADVVCGTVAVRDWTAHGRHAMRLQEHFRATYTDADGHRHVHGANLGISADAYRQAGGFPNLASSEDVAMVRALEAVGARVAWSAAPRVFTSARRVARAPAGFAQALCLAVEAMTAGAALALE